MQEQQIDDTDNRTGPGITNAERGLLFLAFLLVGLGV
jgi:hypothetical protein